MPNHGRIPTSSSARRPAVVAPRISTQGRTAKCGPHAVVAQRFDVVEEQLVRARDFSLIEHASEDHKAALVEVCARRGAVGDVELVDVDEARRFWGCRRYFGAKGPARLRTHARRESYACQRESHPMSAISTSAVSSHCYHCALLRHLSLSCAATALRSMRELNAASAATVAGTARQFWTYRARLRFCPELLACVDTLGEKNHARHRSVLRHGLLRAVQNSSQSPTSSPRADNHLGSRCVRRSR